MATVSLKTIEILTMLGINEGLKRDVICDDMMTDPKVIGHLNIEEAEGIQLACIGYSKMNPAARKFMGTRVH